MGCGSTATCFRTCSARGAWAGSISPATPAPPPVALKILSRERMNNPRALARFRREARVGAQLQHENLIRVYDEGECARRSGSS